MCAIRAITDDYEIIFVNDDSPDDALSVALELQSENCRIKVIDLARNYGHYKALMAGLEHTTGDLVYQTGCNFEEDPANLVGFVERFNEHASEVDVVWGRRDDSYDKPTTKFYRKCYFGILNMFADTKLERDSTISRLMTRRYVDCLVQHRESEIFLPGMWVLTGFEQVAYDVVKTPKGTKTYRLIRKMVLLTNSIVSFSNQPLVWIFYLGSAILSISFLAALFLMVQRVFFGNIALGFASLLVTIWSLGGLVIFTIGVIGIYLSKVYSEAKCRPYSLVKEVFQIEAQVTGDEPSEKRAAEPKESGVSSTLEK